jgi:hypothetical protein
MSTYNKDRRFRHSRIASSESGNSTDETNDNDDDDDDDDESESSSRARLELLLRSGSQFSARIIETSRPQHRRTLAIASVEASTARDRVNAHNPDNSNSSRDSRMDTDENEEAILSNDENLINEQEEKSDETETATAKAQVSKEIDIPKAETSASTSNDTANNMSVTESGFGDESIPSSVDSTQVTLTQSSSLNATPNVDHAETSDSRPSKIARKELLRAEPKQEPVRQNLMRQRIMQLPLSHQVKEFLLYYRNA